MANKRMFCKDVVDTERFYSLPVEAQLLYFHLGLNADVQGFVEPMKIARLVGIKIEAIKPLIDKNFVIPFESGVVVITDWHVNNNVRETREAPSRYIKEQQSITLLEQGIYQVQDNSRSSAGVLPHSIGKDRIDKDRIEKGKVSEDCSKYIERYNSLFKSTARVTDGRNSKLKARLKSFSYEEILTALENMSNTPFYTGKNDRKWIADPDFLIRNDENVDRFLNNVPKKSGLKYATVN